MNRQEAIDYLTQKIPDNEPVFILRAQDRISPIIVSKWIEHAQAYDVCAGKLESAFYTLAQMNYWQQRHQYRVKRPD